MSSKSARKVKLPGPPKAPRTIDELKEIAGKLTMEMGNARYQAGVYLKEVDDLYVALESINKEGAERLRLDKEAKGADNV